MRNLLIVAVMAAMVFVGCEGDDNPTAPPNGSCCAVSGACTVTTQANCTGTWTWTVGGVCSPNPCPPPVSDYVPQTSPANVIANLRTAYGERKIDEYRKLFTDDFIFVFNPADPVDPNHPSPPQWGLVDELDVTENMFTDELVTRIELSSYNFGVPERVDSIEYRPRAWKVRVDHANLQVRTRKPNGELLIWLVDGATEVFYFVERPTVPSPVDGSPTWYIFRWEDQPIGSGKTEVRSWGQVKALFR